SATHRGEVTCGEELRTRVVGGERFRAGVLHTDEHDEDVRTRVRRDVSTRAVHAVGVERDRAPGGAGQHVDTVLVGQVFQRLLVRGADVLTLERRLVVVLRGLADTRHERAVRARHDHQGTVVRVVLRQGDGEADGAHARHAVLGVPGL